MDFKKVDERDGSGSMKSSAIIAVTLATIAISSCLIMFPLLFIRMQAFDSHLQNEFDLCKNRAKDMWKELLEMNSKADNDVTITRLARAAVMSKVDETDKADEPPSSKVERSAQEAEFSIKNSGEDRRRRQSGGCCTCQRGPPGPPGPPGQDGVDGLDGVMGDIGQMGPPAQMSFDPSGRFPEQCPCEAPPGPQGAPGSRGQPGPPGDAGQAGTDGAPGEPGQQGPPGQPGKDGSRGQSGSRGQPGRSSPEEGPPGPPGPPGSPGRPGPIGQPGQAGEPGGKGIDGERGPPGPPGQLGIPGQSGEGGALGSPGERGRCEHCPPPRLAPGY